WRRYEGLLPGRALVAPQARHHLSQRPRRERKRAQPLGGTDAASEHLLRQSQGRCCRPAPGGRGSAALPKADLRVVKRLLFVAVLALVLAPAAAACITHPKLAAMEGQITSAVCGTTRDQ